jgi:hypothetical protein
MPCNRPTPQTFFDLHFEPDIMVGPAALDFLTDFFCRNSASVEGILSILQLAHLKHFDEPLTIFVQDELLDTSSVELAIRKLSDPEAAAFLVSLFSWAFAPQELASNEDGWPVNDVAGLLASITEARADFRSRLSRLKLAFGVMRRVQKVMLDLGYRGAGSDKTPLEMMSASLRGGLAREGKYLGMMTRSVMPLSTPSCPNPNPVFLNSVGYRAGNCLAKSSRSCCGSCARSLTDSQITWMKFTKRGSAWQPPPGCSRTTGKDPTARRSRRSSGIGLWATSSQFSSGRFCLVS